MIPAQPPPRPPTEAVFLRPKHSTTELIAVGICAKASNLYEGSHCLQHPINPKRSHPMSEESIQPEPVVDQTDLPIDEREEEDQPVIDPIQVIYLGQCPSLSARSSLSFHIGQHSQIESLHLRICGNTGGGMYCKDWCAIEQIEAVVLATADLTAHSLHVLHPGKSINTGGFILAVLRSLGYVRAQAGNTRLHEHTPDVSLAQAIQTALETPEPEAEPKQNDTKPTRRKPKEISPV